MKTFLVTGATGGLGLEIVKNLAKGRNNKVIMAVRDLDKGVAQRFLDQGASWADSPKEMAENGVDYICMGRPYFPPK